MCLLGQDDEVNDFESVLLKQKYTSQIAGIFGKIKTELYNLVEANLKQLFVQMYSNPGQDLLKQTTLSFNLLSIIPKDLRMYIREGLIFNSMKIVKAL